MDAADDDRVEVVLAAALKGPLEGAEDAKRNFSVAARPVVAPPLYARDHPCPDPLQVDGREREVGIALRLVGPAREQTRHGLELLAPAWGVLIVGHDVMGGRRQAVEVPHAVPLARVLVGPHEHDVLALPRLVGARADVIAIVCDGCGCGGECIRGGGDVRCDVAVSVAVGARPLRHAVVRVLLVDHGCAVRAQ